MGEVITALKESSSKRVPIEEIKKKLMSNAMSLHISRVPARAKRRFKELAKSEFNDDYGLTLMYLLDRYDDIQILMTLLDQVNQLHSIVTGLLVKEAGSAKVEIKENKIVKTVSGRVIKADKEVEK